MSLTSYPRDEVYRTTSHPSVSSRDVDRTESNGDGEHPLLNFLPPLHSDAQGKIFLPRRHDASSGRQGLSFCRRRKASPVSSPITFLSPEVLRAGPYGNFRSKCHATILARPSPNPVSADHPSFSFAGFDAPTAAAESTLSTVTPAPFDPGASASILPATSNKEALSPEVASKTTAGDEEDSLACSLYCMAAMTARTASSTKRMSACAFPASSDTASRSHSLLDSDAPTPLKSPPAPSPSPSSAPAPQFLTTTSVALLILVPCSSQGPYTSPSLNPTVCTPRRTPYVRANISSISLVAGWKFSSRFPLPSDEPASCPAPAWAEEERGTAEYTPEWEA
mmetsp:Transcript_29361/g.87005  ORF Transcript_29361/g.87005 Transcript_29361/m.87005 type:complete len:337 (+) Transcript_29361:990-2000(+)